MTDLLDTAAVARLAGVKRMTISAYLARGYMPVPHMRLGQSPVWTPEQIEAWLASRPGRGRRRALGEPSLSRPGVRGGSPSAQEEAVVPVGKAVSVEDTPPAPARSTGGALP